MLTGYLFALAAGASYGVAQVLTRHGVSTYASPLIGACISMFFGTLGVALLNARDFRTTLRSDGLGRGIFLFTLAGLTGSGGVVLHYIALSQAPVVVVSPVLGVNPLVTLLCAAFFLRGLEHISLRLVAGSLLVVAGVVCIALATTLRL